MQCIDCGLEYLGTGACPRCRRSEQERRAGLPRLAMPKAPDKFAPRYKQCPECGLATLTDMAQCPQCGHKYRTKFAAALQPVAAPAASHTVSVGCVLCGSSAVLKVSAVANGNQAVGQAAAPLSTHMAPPNEPVYATPPCVYGVMLCAGAFIILLAATILERGALPLVALTCFAMASTAGMLYVASGRVPASRYEYQEAQNRYQRAMEEWNMLFYCPKCERIYHPISRKTAPLRAMQTLLYSADTFQP